MATATPTLPARTARSSWIAGTVFLGAALAGGLLRVPAIVEPIGIDQGIFATAGWGLKHGLTLYRDVWDQKPPGVHLTYALGFAAFGERAAALALLDLAAALATALFLGAFARRTSGWLAGIATSAAYLLLALPAGIYHRGGFLERAVPETFVALFVSAAVWVAAVPDGRGIGAARQLVAGLLVGAAACFKPNALVFACVVVAWAWRSGRQFSWRPVAWVAAGLVVVPAALAVWLAERGVLTDAWIAVFDYNRAYLTVQSTFIQLLGRVAQELFRHVRTEPLWAVAALGAAAGLWPTVRARKTDALWFVAIAWWGCAIVALAANGIRLYSTYFITSHPAMALLAGGMLSGAGARRPLGRGLAVAAAVVVIGVAAWNGGVGGRAARYTRLDLRAWWTDSSGSGEYLAKFSGSRRQAGYSVVANAELADWLRQRTAPSDRVFIFGMAPSVYFMAQRLPSNRFVWVYPPLSGLVSRPGFDRASFAADLGRSSPAVIVFQQGNRDTRTGWTAETDFAIEPIQALLRQYRHVADVGSFEVFQRH